MPLQDSIPDSPVLLDVSRLIWRAWRGQLPTGIDRACLAYADHFSDQALAVVQRGGFTLVLDRENSRRIFQLLLSRPSDFKWQIGLVTARAILSRSARVGSNQIYLNIGHTGLDRRGHALWVERTEVRAIYYVHDLIPITHPQFVRDGEAGRHAKRMIAVLTHAHSIFANSEASVSDLRQFAAEHHLSMPSAYIIPLASEPLRPADTSVATRQRSYFAVLGTIEGRKNHILLLKIWKRLIRQWGDKVPQLVIIGQRGWAADDVFRMLDGDEELSRDVIELDRCDDSELASYLMGARALLFPTFVEGQGLPLTEALSLGTPVIASDLAVFRETAGDIPEYLDPTDEKGWIEAIEDYAQPDSARRVEQIKRIRGFEAMTWSEHFAQVERLLANSSDNRNQRRFRKENSRATSKEVPALND